MPVSQTAANVLIAYKIQSGIGVPAIGAGATGLRVKPTNGLKLGKQIIASAEVRRDGQSTRGRHGSRSGSAGYGAELSVGTFDGLFEALMRGTWVAATVVTTASMTSITTTATTIVAAGGSWLTQGIRRGDLIKLTGTATAANNGKYFRVVDVTATVITLPLASLTVNAVADSTGSVTISKTVIPAATPIERYWTLEDYGIDIDASLLGTDMKVSKMDLSIQPNANIDVTWTFVGRDVQPVTSATAPNFTTPTYSTTLPLVMVDGVIRINGIDQLVLTGFTLSYDLGGTAPPVLAPTSPDVFLDNAKLSGSFTAIRQDLTNFLAYSNETTLDFFIHCEDNAPAPSNFVSFYVGNATLSDVTSAIASSGPMTETVPWMAGKDELGGAHAPAMLKIATSAP